MTSTVVYSGELRTNCVHLQSGIEIITDAPKDNHGKGEAFSPTDLVATALSSCMLTVMGIKANSMPLNIDGAKAEVTKIMQAEPRRIAEIIITIHMPERSYTDKEKIIMEHTAKTCPVLYSLHPDLIKTIQFVWS